MQDWVCFKKQDMPWMLSKSGDLKKIWWTIFSSGIIFCVRLDQQKVQVGSALPLLKQVTSTLNHNHCLCDLFSLINHCFLRCVPTFSGLWSTSRNDLSLLENLKLSFLWGFIVRKFQKCPRWSAWTKEVVVVVVGHLSPTKPQRKERSPGGRMWTWRFAVFSSRTKNLLL